MPTASWTTCCALRATGACSRDPPPNAPYDQPGHAPDRRFGPDELRALPRDQRRELAQVLLTDGAAHVVEFHSTAAHDEFVFEVPPLWRPRRVRVRIADQPVDAAALAALGGGQHGRRRRRAHDRRGGRDGPDEGAVGVMLVEPADFIARLERSISIAWPDRLPHPAYDGVQVRRDLERDAFLLDAVGLRWLPSLALHKLPAELAGAGIAPEDLFERVAFRLMSWSLRFGGERFGKAARGERLPDAILRWPPGRSDGLQGHQLRLMGAHAREFVWLSVPPVASA